jgi:peroxiredoxin
MTTLKAVLTLVVCTLLSFGAIAQPSIGQTAPDIQLPDTEGNTTKLSSYKGKVVLIDFWASWCGPCRSASKSLVKLYNKYKSKGLEIFGVSIDDESESWIEAIKKDKMKWIQVNDPGGWDAPIAKKWGIQYIPHSFLLDKKGKVVAIDAEGSALEAAIKKLLK